MPDFLILSQMGEDLITNSYRFDLFCAFLGMNLGSGGKTSFDIVDRSPLFGYNHRPLELACVLGVYPEIRLERYLHFHALRDEDEASPGPYGGVQGRELVVVYRDNRAEMLLDDLRMPGGTVWDHTMGLLGSLRPV